VEYYAKGIIEEGLRHKIENHLLDCPLCAEAAEGYALLKGDTAAVFEDMFAEIDAKTTEKNKIAVTRSFPWNKIAASLLFLVMIGAAFWYYQNMQFANQYEAYFNNEEMQTVRGIDEASLPIDLQAGLKLYQQKNFQGSLSFFEDYLKVNPESTVATYFAGMSALNIGEEETAFDFLTTVRMNDDRLYDEASWNLVGIHLERGEVETAKQLLEDLLKVDNDLYRNRAKDLLEKLHSVK